MNAVSSRSRFLGTLGNIWLLAKRDFPGYRPRFDGRGTRTECLVTLIACFTANIVWMAFFRLIDFDGGSSRNSDLNTLISIATGIVLYLPFFAALVRRLHDTNRNLFAALVIIFPYIGPFLFLGILLWTGDEGANSYGPNPRPMKV